MSQLQSVTLSRIILIAAIVIVSGCYTYAPMTNDEQTEGYPRIEDEIRITLTDGSLIESPAYLHVLTREPSDLIVGIGQERKKSTPFKGVIVKTDLDSSKEVSTKEGLSYICWLKNKTSIAFKPNEYLKLTGADPPGFWCAGPRTSPDGTTDFKGMVTRGQIGGIEVKKFDYETTAYITIAPAALFFLAIQAGRFAYHEK